MQLYWYFIFGIIVVVFIWLAIVKSVQAHKQQVQGGQEGLIGKTGSAKTDINPSGKFYVFGEYWDAQAKGEPLKAGDKGRVVEVKEFESKFLIVEKFKQ